jgi:hypothetical protein
MLARIIFSTHLLVFAMGQIAMKRMAHELLFMGHEEDNHEKY